jgi:hypothetical protein
MKIQLLDSLPPSSPPKLQDLIEYVIVFFWKKLVEVHVVWKVPMNMSLNFFASTKMKLALAVASILLTVDAFVPAGQRLRPSLSIFNIADEFGIPCEEECALESYPNLPESVHPGVVSGKALLDLLNHAKENGKNYIANFSKDFQFSCFYSRTFSCSTHSRAHNNLLP